MIKNQLLYKNILFGLVVGSCAYYMPNLELISTVNMFIFAVVITEIFAQFMKLDWNKFYDKIYNCIKSKFHSLINNQIILSLFAYLMVFVIVLAIISLILLSGCAIIIWIMTCMAELSSKIESSAFYTMVSLWGGYISPFLFGWLSNKLKPKNKH